MSKPVRFVYNELDKFPRGCRIQSECEDGPRYFGNTIRESILNYCEEHERAPEEYKFLLNIPGTYDYEEIDFNSL